MFMKIFRRGSARCIGLLSAFITILLCLYYISIGQPTPTPTAKELYNKKYTNFQYNTSWQHFIESGLNIIKHDNSVNNNININRNNNYKLIYDNQTINQINENWGKCINLVETETDITTIDEYSKFNFQPEWIKTREYWDKTFEEQYEALIKDKKRPPLKIIIVPHSHNDPGWLRTFTNYFQTESRQILNLIVKKLQKYTDMTFIWSEISILQLWWDQAHPIKQRALKQLVQSGRIEITTGGWVMTDEANVHIYAMLDQFIEGHQWVKSNLNVTPSVGWSIDPFGHGSTVPYMLAASKFDGAIIQRIHYAWKQWLAKHKYGDFIWHPYWTNLNPSTVSQANTHSLYTHNMPFDIYSIKHSCGPHPFICLNFDFRKIPDEHTEYSIKAQFITDENVQAKADLLIEQYSRTASLYPHNVALIPIGDDFRYNKEREVEQQYTNYKKLIDYINDNFERYGTEIAFGTPKDYFTAIKKRTKKLPSLKGDFFVYSDIFTEGRPAYWSGYYTTRPMYKILSRDLEHNLRNAEILFTFAFNKARQQNNANALRIYEKNYEILILARRDLGLFQHHDAITGTSKANVMRDYGNRLFKSIQDSVKLQESTVEVLIQKTTNEHNFILSELERDCFNKMPRKTPIVLTPNKSSEFIVFNSLAQKRLEVVLIRTITPKVKVIDPDGKEIDIQINPVWNITQETQIIRNILVSDKEFEIMFIAVLPPLSLVTYRIVYSEELKGNLATLYCNECKDDKHDTFVVKNKQTGDIQLENLKMRLLFDEETGFLKSVTKKNMGKPIQCAIKFGAYYSAQFRSGAYLFKTDPERSETEKNVLEQYSDVKILITSGPIASDVTVIYGPFLAHTVRIFNSKTDLDKAIYIENDIDFEAPPKNRETELYMRFLTDIENGEIPEYYSDLNGFQYQHRVKVPKIGVEGNYFPITTGAFIQDDNTRMTLLTTHAQGSASLQPGQLEVMLDRRMLYDDYRGMGEGIVDSKLTRHRFWVFFEDLGLGSNGNIPPDVKQRKEYQTLSLFGNQMSNALNYPANIYFIEKPDEKIHLEYDKNITLLNHKFPCDVHLITLRTLTEENMPLFPSRSSLLVLQRQSPLCRVKNDDNTTLDTCESTQGFANSLFNQIHTEEIISTSLTGLKPSGIIKQFSSIYIEPMELRTFNFTFSK